MRHKIGYKKLNRTSEHRKALIKNMLNSLIKYEQIITTLPKAKLIKPQAEKLITLGKKKNLVNTRVLISKLQDKTNANKILNTLNRVCVFAIENGDMKTNPVRDVDPLPTETQ